MSRILTLLTHSLYDWQDYTHFKSRNLSENISSFKKCMSYTSLLASSLLFHIYVITIFSTNSHYNLAGPKEGHYFSSLPQCSRYLFHSFHDWVPHLLPAVSFCHSFLAWLSLLPIDLAKIFTSSDRFLISTRLFLWSDHCHWLDDSRMDRLIPVVFPWDMTGSMVCSDWLRIVLLVLMIFLAFLSVWGDSSGDGQLCGIRFGNISH